MINIMFCIELFRHFGYVFTTFIYVQNLDLLFTLVFNKLLESLKDFKYFVLSVDHIDP